jgi:hypothetical protein
MRRGARDNFEIGSKPRVLEVIGIVVIVEQFSNQILINQEETKRFG